MPDSAFPPDFSDHSAPGFSHHPAPGSSHHPAPGPDELAALLAQALDADAREEARSLAEVAGDLEALEAAPPEMLRSDVRAAALAAWETTTVAESAHAVAAARPTAAVRVLRAAAAPAPHWLRWAALLLIGLGVTLFAVLTSPEEATAGLRLGTLYRLDAADGRQETTFGRRIPWGERIAARGSEVLGFRLPDGSAVALRDEGWVRLGRAEDGSAVLELGGGVAQIAVAAGGEVRLAAGTCRLHLLEGRAWAAGGAGAFALGPTGRGRLVGPGGEDRLLEGPLTWTCDASGAFLASGEISAPERFRLPAVLAAAHLGRAPGRQVAARLWRVTGGEARRRGTSIEPGRAGVQLAWRPSPDVRAARTLRLRIEGGEGLVVSLAGDAAEPVPLAGRTTDLALPPDWATHLTTETGELVLQLAWSKPGDAGARFLGAAFLTADETNAAVTDARSPRRE